MNASISYNFNRMCVVGDKGTEEGRARDVNAVPGPSNPLIYVHDESDNRRWLVDGGALISIIPPTLHGALKDFKIDE